MLRLLAGLLVGKALDILFALVVLTLENYQGIDEEIPRPSGPSDWFEDVVGAGLTGGVLGALAGSSLALSLVQFQLGLVGAFAIEWQDWIISYIFLAPLGWLVVGPLGSAVTDLSIWDVGIRIRRIILMGGGFFLAAAASI